MANLHDSATGPGNLDDILTSTLMSRMTSKEVTDQIFNKYPVLYYFTRPKPSTVDGGERIVQRLEYEENQTAGFMSPYQELDTTPTETLSEALYNPVQLAASVTISMMDEAKNQMGPARIVNLVEHRRANATRTLEHLMSQALFNAAPGALLPWSLYEIIDSADPSRANLGGIDRDTYTWWGAQETALSSFATGGIAAMNLKKRQCSASGGADEPDLVIFGQTGYGWYENALQPQMRYGSTKLADGAFQTLKAGNATCVWDKDAPNDVIWFLNKDAISMDFYKGYFLRVTPFVKPSRSTTRTAQIVCIYQVCAKSPRRLGKLTGVAA
jgi:hypothetical protein